jgi:uncharacterized membrane protein YfcA
MEGLSIMGSMAYLAGAAAIAGFSRGFASFGTAMIYVPLVALAYDTQTAVVTLFLVDLIPALLLIRKAAPQCDWRTLSWMAIGAVALSPLGVAFLLIADPVQSQFVLGLVLLAAVTYMILKSSFRIRTSPLNSIVAGAVSGFAGGLCGIFGPPATVYLYGRNVSAMTSRSDMIVYVTGESIVLGLNYLFYGMYSLKYLEIAGALIPIYGFFLWIGAHVAARANETSYRRVVLVVLWLISAVLVVKAFPGMASVS